MSSDNSGTHTSQVDNNSGPKLPHRQPARYNPTFPTVVTEKDGDFKMRNQQPIQKAQTFSILDDKNTRKSAALDQKRIESNFRKQKIKKSKEDTTNKSK